MSHRVVSTDGKTADLLADAFTWHGFDASVQVVTPASTEGLVDAAAGADALVVDAETEVTEAVFTGTPVRVVGRAGVGVDNIDLDAARRYDVPVVHVPDYCTEEVATHSLSLMLAAWRRLRPSDALVRDGEWPREPTGVTGRLSEATVGLVAFGAVGRRLARLLSGFDVDLVGYDPHVEESAMRAAGVQPVSFDSLLRRSSLVATTAPLTEETEGLLDAAAFETLPRDAVVVNTGRGGVVDEDALSSALDSGEIAGAGLDVLESEPPTRLPTDHPNVVYTPHVGWYSEQSLETCVNTVTADVARVLTGEPPHNPITGDW